MPRELTHAQQRDHDDRQRLLRGDAQLSLPDQIVLRRDPGDEHARIFGEGHGHGGDGSGLDHQKHGPAEEESAQGAEGFAQIDVLAAGVRHGRGELPVGERRDQRERRRPRPR